MEIYKVLPQTNCSRCLLPSCLAFSSAVLLGTKKFSDCPFLEKETVNRLTTSLNAGRTNEPQQAAFLDKLEEKICQIDLQQKAPVIGATYRKQILTINCLGKDFQINQQGKITSECHVISWVTAPILSYITNKQHIGITGRWISFREINGGMEWQNLFTSRCENTLRKLADENPTLLEDIIDLFQGEPVDIFRADINLILHPLPHIPILISYQAAEEDLDSELTIFFDQCCGTNLHINSIFTLCTGIVRMFEKIADRHL